MLSEHKMREQAGKAQKWNIIIFCIFAAIFAILIFAICVFKYQHTYTRSKWDNDRENRHKIVSDMLSRNQLDGMTETEVIQLLGNEDNNGQTTFKISRNYFPPESTLVYYLGVDLMDNCWLVISLDGGVVTEYCIDVT